MPRIVIAGGINMDLVAKTERFPQKGETVFGTDLSHFPGGKGANQAVASARLGAQTVFVGRVGDDVFGERLRTFLTEEQIDLAHLSSSQKPTGVALITVAQEDNQIVVVPGANNDIAPTDLPTDFRPDDVLVSQLEIPTETVTAFFKAGKTAGATTVFNPAPAKTIPKDLLRLCDVIILNETELAFLAEADMSKESSDDVIAREARQLRSENKQRVVVTLGERGLLALSEDDLIRIHGHEIEAVDTTGAGDCFVGALAVALSEQQPFHDALEFANKAAALSVQKQGAGPSMPRRSDF